MSEGQLIGATPEFLRVRWADGVIGEFAAVWLRDNAREDRDPYSGQRLIDVADLPPAPRIRQAQLRAGEVLIEWQNEARITSHPLSWLAAVAGGPPALPRVDAWLDGAARDSQRDFAWGTLAEWRARPAARLEWLTRLQQTGLAFLRGLPSTDDALLEAVAPMGRILETNYGCVFDVRAVAQPENLAYSDVGLGLHTDNPYREPVPGFQALHVLLAAPDGGASLFADGFALSEHLRTAEPAAWRLLTTTAVPFHYRSAQADLYAERPLIQLSCRGEVAAVHYNSRSIAPLRRHDGDVGDFYAAYRRFAALLREPAHQMRIMLRAGDLAVFDNQRILHGRTGFASARHARHLRGCYLSRDSVQSQTAVLRGQLRPEESE